MYHLVMVFGPTGHKGRTTIALEDNDKERIAVMAKEFIDFMVEVKEPTDGGT